MKRYSILSFICAASVLFASSCRKDDAQVPESDTVTITLNVSVDDVRTKAENQTAQEKAVNSLDVFIFRSSDGLLEYRGRIETGATQINGITLTLGEKEFWCITNASASAVSSLARASQFPTWHRPFAENVRGGLIAKGTITQTVTTATTTVTVPVRRDVLKVELLSAPVFSGEMAGATFEGMYMVNVPKTYSETASYSILDAPRLWNFRNVVATSAEQTDMCTATNWNKILYAYPNATNEGDGSEDFTTKLSIKVSHGGYIWWYPVPLPATTPNTVYSITSIQISKTGSLNPNDLVLKEAASFSLSVTPWGYGPVSGLPDNETWKVEN